LGQFYSLKNRKVWGCGVSIRKWRLEVVNISRHQKNEVGGIYGWRELRGKKSMATKTNSISRSSRIDPLEKKRERNRSLSFKTW